MYLAASTAKGGSFIPPEEDARAILRALRHETSLVASLDPAFAQENWGCLAQQSLSAMTWGAFNSLPVVPVG